VSFADRMTGLAVVTQETIVPYNKRRSIWQTRNQRNNELPRGISFVDLNTATIVGQSGVILANETMEAILFSQTSTTTNDLHCVSFANQNIGHYGWCRWQNPLYDQRGSSWNNCNGSNDEDC